MGYRTFGVTLALALTTLVGLVTPASAVPATPPPAAPANVIPIYSYRVGEQGPGAGRFAGHVVGHGLGEALAGRGDVTVAQGYPDR